MKKIVAFFLLMTGLNSCHSDAQTGAMDVKNFDAAIQSGAYQLLDVRTAGEYQSGHLKAALQADWNNRTEFLDRIQYLDKSKPLLVYCASGVRSANAAQFLSANGFKNVQNLKGGLTAWKMEGKPVQNEQNNRQMSMETYAAALQKSPVVLVDFGAEWCPPCKKMEPVINQLKADKTLAFSLFKVDGGLDIDVMKAQHVDALPVFIMYKNGKETWRKQGVVDVNELKKQLSK